jgi:hypothetical protein
MIAESDPDLLFLTNECGSGSPGSETYFCTFLLQAASTLQKIGRTETDILARRKTQLSLAKLAALAAEDEQLTLLEQLDQDLLLVEAQVRYPFSGTAEGAAVTS